MNYDRKGLSTVRINPEISESLTIQTLSPQPCTWLTVSRKVNLLALNLLDGFWQINQDVGEGAQWHWGFRKTAYFPPREGKWEILKWGILSNRSVVRTFSSCLMSSIQEYKFPLKHGEDKEVNYLNPWSMMWPTVVPNHWGKLKGVTECCCGCWLTQPALP